VFPPVPEPTETGAEPETGPAGVVESRAGPAVTGADWIVSTDPEAALPPPSCTEPIESVAELLPVPPIVSGAIRATCPNGRVAAIAAATTAAPDWTVRREFRASLPPPSCTAPIESVALLPLPAIPAVSPAWSVEPATRASRDGLVRVAPTCTVPIERLAEFPPPACTEPTEFDALFEPPPPTVVGAWTCTALPATCADTDGLVVAGLA
jgi:hypothetical protein